jgi:hypothetical protein
MKEEGKVIFISLFKETCQKCFGIPLVTPLSETDSRLLSTTILEHTGLVIGAKSIKNYSYYALRITGTKVKKENPSAATLDTLARYVLEAPYTSEVSRKEKEGHFPYWYQYKSRFPHEKLFHKKSRVIRKRIPLFLFLIMILSIGFFIVRSLNQKPHTEDFTDHFNSVLEDSLISRGWVIKGVDTAWWKKRNEKQGHLALFTLRGDNWALGNNPAGIRNLLIREIHAACFTIEVSFTDFMPEQNWQQAGLLLSEDTSYTGNMLRLSISYNDFFGGFEKPAEIIIQTVSSSKGGLLSKPEEVNHFTLFSIEPGREDLVSSNLAKFALKIEKQGNHFRFLYAMGSIESFAFKEVGSGDFNLQPGYVSLFSIQGWADNNCIPAYFDSFRFVSDPCTD